jgi:FtsP/CotA-like multicopper oxidase with cupredoxin domain
MTKPPRKIRDAACVGAVNDHASISRRQVLGGGIVATVATLGLQTLGLQATATAQTAPAPVPANPAPVPARTLAAAAASRQLKPSPSAPTAVWSIDGTVPGPVLRIKAGESLRVKLDNKTAKPLSLHWHGLRHASTADGVGGFSQAPAAPGANTEYVLTPPDSGSFIYRPMVVGGSSEPQARGIGGLLVVEERNAPKVDHDIALVVDDWLLTPEGQLAPFPATLATPEGAAGGRLGNWLTVNGRPVPERTLFAPGSRLRLRLANLCNARTLRIRFDNLKAHVIAIDGQPTDTFEPLRATLPFAPGTRYDVLVDLAEEAGVTGTITGMIGPGVPLFMAVTEGAPQGTKRPALPPIGPLAPNPALPPAVRLQDAVRPELAISGGAVALPDGKLDISKLDLARPWSVTAAQGGKPVAIKPGDATSPPAFSVKRGSPIVLRITNSTIFPQPLHVHGHVFRMLHPLDDGWEPYFLDTIIVPDGKTIQIAFIADNPGRWLISSTVAERFDVGLWTWFEVTA